MSNPKVDSKEFQQNIRSKEMAIATVGTVVAFYAANGTSTATAIYLNIPDNKGSTKQITELIIRTSQTIQVTKWNGVAIVPDPITVTTAGFKDENCEIASFEITTQIADTQLSVIAR